MTIPQTGENSRPYDEKQLANIGHPDVHRPNLQEDHCLAGHLEIADLANVWETRTFSNDLPSCRLT